MAQAHVRCAIDPQCPSHPSTEAIFVCLENQCDEQLACPKCITGAGNHNKHNVELLENHLGIFKKKINDYNTNTREQILGPLKKMVDRVTDDLEAFDPATSSILDEIETRGKEINEQTSTLVTEFKTKCSQIRSCNRQKMEHYRSRLLGKITEIEADISALDRFLAGDCKADIVNAAKSGLCKKYQDLPYPDDIKDVSFKVSDTPLNDVANLLGTVLIGNEQVVRAEPYTETIKRLEDHIKSMEQKKRIDEARIQKSKKELHDCTQRGQDYQAHIANLQEELQNARKEGQYYQAHNGKLQEELQSARKEITADAHEKKKMQDSINDLRALGTHKVKTEFES
ncbi:uncharacterized protein LOC117332114 [Pecten maximus]|uniref:uncharacterized protein LOC117332114 n=1 Tax=Pecten maximus TaxID=6579 RepID=UPI001458F65E|nr:uncharacterized protein LOC117332114 [Pecten maximus]